MLVHYGKFGVASLGHAHGHEIFASDKLSFMLEPSKHLP